MATFSFCQRPTPTPTPTQTLHHRHIALKYPSLWLSPINNTLYFSSLNFNANDSNEYNYCLLPLLSLNPSISYTLNIQYDQSKMIITSNNTIIFKRFHWFSLIQNKTNLSLYISDSESPVSISNLFIITSIDLLPPTITAQLDSDIDDTNFHHDFFLFNIYCQIYHNCFIFSS